MISKGKIRSIQRNGESQNQINNGVMLRNVNKVITDKTTTSTTTKWDRWVGTIQLGTGICGGMGCWIWCFDVWSYCIKQTYCLFCSISRCLSLLKRINGFHLQQPQIQTPLPHHHLPCNPFSPCFFPRILANFVHLNILFHIIYLFKYILSLVDL